MEISKSALRHWRAQTRVAPHMIDSLQGLGVNAGLFCTSRAVMAVFGQLAFLVNVARPDTSCQGLLPTVAGSLSVCNCIIYVCTTNTYGSTGFDSPDAVGLASPASTYSPSRHTAASQTEIDR